MFNSCAIQRVNKEDFGEITEVWEASVRATHHFLPESDIAYFRPLILHEYLKAVDLYAVRNDQGRILGFLGVAAGKIEMLFVDPAAMGKGIGRRLLQFAVEKLGALKLDVNEQNEQAAGFYRKMGFMVSGRSPVDGMGKPYPLLHMEFHSPE